MAKERPASFQEQAVIPHSPADPPPHTKDLGPIAPPIVIILTPAIVPPEAPGTNG